MFKIFGKIRYHWQPELSWATIYWSFTMMPLFIALSLLYERTERPSYVFMLLGLFLTLSILGVHRYFVIRDDTLEMVSFNLFKSRKLNISEICKIEVTKSTLKLIMRDDTSYLFQMRKWPKKYFLDALAVHEHFQGEVELLDNFITLDYFEVYKDDKKAPTL
ncbi:EbsA family protein [Streptococcus fryi]